MGIQTILDAVSLLTFATAFLFGVLEIRRAARARHERGAIDLFITGVIHTDFVAALYTVFDLPPDAPPEQVRTSKEVMQAANLLINQFEFWGVTVFQRIVPLRTFDLFMGGGVRSAWSRLHSYIKNERRAPGNHNIGEWFQWLADRLESHPAPEKRLGAHIAFNNWRP